VSHQYQAHDGAGGFSYGYEDENAKKEEKKVHGVTSGGFSLKSAKGHHEHSIHYVHAPVKVVVHKEEPHHYQPEPKSHYYHSHAPVVLHHGVPEDTPEVKHAKAEHFAAVAAAKGHYIHKRSPPKPFHYTSVAYHPKDVPHYHHHHDEHIPVIHKGVPLDTPEVAHAKLEHFAAHAKAAAHSHYEPEPEYHHAPAVHHAEEPHHHEYKYHGPEHYPVIKHGVPVEPEAVQHARAEHLAAVAHVQHSQHHHDDHHWEEKKHW
jgi:hypothetical protein